ncbi:MAG: hypothetical protein JNL83_33645 [Myxococcales bacterium]|nr:hypothetical protein [Myxococcales bacterium]
MKRAALAAIPLVAASAAAEPLRLRGDALATTASPAGLLVLNADGKLEERLSAEAVVWMAGSRTPGEDTTGDVLVIAVRGRSRDGKTNARLGRFVSTMGALRPVHVDGGSVRLRLPHRFDAEAVAGVPVVLGLGTGRAWDWVAGGRVSRRIGFGGSVGVAYAQRRDRGVRASEELGADVGAELNKRTDVGARAAYDLVGEGLAEIMVSASHRRGALRAEAYASQRSPSHLVPATSLFSVIGDVPAQRAGGVLTWRAAPRLDVIGDLAALRVDDDLGTDLTARGRLRLDDKGAGQITGELRRSGVDDHAWTGARLAVRVPVSRQITLSSEIELIVPDDDRRGAAWPWGLAAASWRCADWEAAIAVEASASPEYTRRLDGLFQLSRRWEGP